MPPRTALVATLVLSLPLGLAGCGGSDGGGGGVPSGAVCPVGNTTLRYNGGGNGSSEPTNFARNFFDTNCTGCHGPAGGNVQGQNFTTYAGIVPKLSRIDERAAAGPTQVNASMPPVPPQPSVADRRLLGTWIACGAPEN